jgi:hypothetical protein
MGRLRIGAKGFNSKKLVNPRSGATILTAVTRTSGTSDE